MKNVLLIVSAILIIYPLYGIFKCLLALDTLTNYGMGVLVGGLIMVSAGAAIMYFTLKSMKQKKQSSHE